MSIQDRRLWDWGGERGERPPFDLVDAESLERDLRAAAADWSEQLAAIVGDPSPPTFENTLLALDRGPRRLNRVRELLTLYATTASSEAIDALQARIGPELARLDDAVLLDPALFQRIDQVRQGAEAAGLADEDLRLVEVMHGRLARAGAGLDEAGRTRLAQINADLAAAADRFRRNMTRGDDETLVLVESAAELEGVSASVAALGARTAQAQGRAGAWVLPMQRPVVMSVLTSALDRGLRERVWRAWTTRCDCGGPNDNREVLAQLLSLRLEKARLLGHRDWAHYAMSDRMLDDPDAVLALLQTVWDRLLPVTLAQLDDLQALAREDGLSGRLEPWDRYFYAERLRQSRFGVDASELRQYLTVDGVIAAALEAASRLHGLEVVAEPDGSSHHPDVRAFSVRQGGRLIGMLHVDVVSRPGKRQGSWQQALQLGAGSDDATVSVVITNAPSPPPGEPALMEWAHAVVTFHELGHGLHMLHSRTRHAGLGPLGVPWDFIELPSLINERWIEDRDLMRRRLRHWRTGEPIPERLIEAVEAAARHDRVFSMTLDFLAGAIIDMKLHLSPDGEVPDAAVVEAETLRALGMPHAVDQILRPPYFFHLSTPLYAAGVYSYLWGDVMAADVAQAFLEAPGGLYDAQTAQRWRDTLLCVGNAVPVDAAFRAFRGRDPEPEALFARFGIALEPA